LTWLQRFLPITAIHFMKYHDSRPYEEGPGRLQKTGRKQAPEITFPAGCFFILAWMADMCKELAEKRFLGESLKNLNEAVS